MTKTQTLTYQGIPDLSDKFIRIIKEKGLDAKTICKDLLKQLSEDEEKDLLQALMEGNDIIVKEWLDKGVNPKFEI